MTSSIGTDESAKSLGFIDRMLDFVKANPAYEEMEGIVAGIPRTAQSTVAFHALCLASPPTKRNTTLVRERVGPLLVEQALTVEEVETKPLKRNPRELAQAIVAALPAKKVCEIGIGQGFQIGRAHV